jgi:RecA-family ATPase
MPLQNLARKHQIVILAIAHFRKASADGANDRVGGSGALIQVARSVLLVAKTEDKPDSTSGELHQTKHNLNSRKKGKKYSIVSVKLTDAITTSRIEWGGDSDKDFDTLIAPKDPADRQIDRCAEWLRSFLEEAECLATEVVTHANRHGFTQSTLYRAKSLIHIHTRKDDNGCSHWSLPDHALETR